MTISKHYIKWLHVGFWLVLFLFPFSFGLQQESLLPVLRRISVPFALQISIAYFNLYILVPRLVKRKRYGLYVLSIILILLGTSRMLIYWFNSYFPEFQMRRTIPGSDMTFGELPEVLQTFPPLIFTLVILFISTVYGLVVEQTNKDQANLLLEKEKTEAELKFLRSQMNPHFFFNALNNLYSIIKLKPDEVDQFIQRLSEMLRYVTYECQNGRIKLLREVQVIESYIFLNSKKDESNIKVNLTKDIRDAQIEIEPMLILPLLENAFKHGYAITGEQLDIWIAIKHDNGLTTIRVENSLPTTSSKTNSAPSETGIGLSNIRQRLKHAYPEAHTLEVDHRPEKYVVALSIRHE